MSTRIVEGVLLGVHDVVRDLSCQSSAGQSRRAEQGAF